MNEQLERKQMDYSRGKIAGHEVYDNEANLIVGRGDMITDEAIQKAKENGKLQYLMLAAFSTVSQASGEEIRERLQEFRDVTEGHEADLVRGGVSAHDVQDYEGNVLVQAGETITDETIDRVSKKGMLTNLVLAVAASGQHAMGAEQEEFTEAKHMGHQH